jgi:hypothetical protein
MYSLYTFVPQRIEYLQKHGHIPEAGVGMTITDKAPYTILAFNPKGPIGRTGMVRVGDQLLYVDDIAVGVSPFSCLSTCCINQNKTQKKCLVGAQMYLHMTVNRISVQHFTLALHTVQSDV